MEEKGRWLGVCLNCDLSDLCDLRDGLTWRVGDVGWGGCLNCSLSDLCDFQDEITWYGWPPFFRPRNGKVKVHVEGRDWFRPATLRSAVKYGLPPHCKTRPGG